jgi:hypothetical protein
MQNICSLHLRPPPSPPPPLHKKVGYGTSQIETGSITLQYKKGR